MTPSVQRIDFSAQSSGLAKSYTDFYALVIDNAFSAEECRALVELASASAAWSPAGLPAHATMQTVHSEFRNSERILCIDDSAAKMIYERLHPFVKDIDEIKPDGPWSCITGKKGRKEGPTWKLLG